MQSCIATAQYKKMVRYLKRTRSNVLILAFVDDTFFQHTVMRGFAAQVLRRRNGRDDQLPLSRYFLCSQFCRIALHYVYCKQKIYSQRVKKKTSGKQGNFKEGEGGEEGARLVVIREQ